MALQYNLESSEEEDINVDLLNESQLKNINNSFFYKKLNLNNDFLNDIDSVIDQMKL